MENSVKRKINIFGKVARIITTVIIVLLLVAEGFMLAGGIIVAVVPKDAVTVNVSADADVNINTGYFGLDGDRFYFDMGGAKVALGELGDSELNVRNSDGGMSFNADVKDMYFDLNSALLLIVYGMISLASIIMALYFFRALMKQFMLCDSPFTDGVVQKLRNFAIALIPCVAVAQGMRAAMQAVISDSFTLGFDFISVAFVFIIFVLTMIFKYGAMLQKEHDETV